MKKFREAYWMLAVASLFFLMAGLFYLWQGPSSAVAASAPTDLNQIQSIDEPIQPIPFAIDLDQSKVALGKRLFTDPILSDNNTVSCASCHELNSGGVDHRQYAVGINEQVNTVNSPTIYNSSLSFRQFWDGRAETLNDQVGGPISNPVEMGSNWTDVIQRLNASPEYVSTFGSIYKDGITATNIADSITVFEQSLTTPNSRFDQYLRGDTKALTTDEAQGYALFKSYGCITCHQGAGVGGNMYQRLGIVEDYFAARGNVTKTDYGRFNVTGLEADRYVFKVPSLRMVALTAPYFHDGTVVTLDDAVHAMATYQLGRAIPDEDIHLIVAFLKTLPGDNAELTVQH